eukprot:gene30411-37698_t
MEDSKDWIHRLRIVGIDLRDPAQVVALADSVAAQGPLDILINNAAQTVRRSPGAYGALVDAESGALSLALVAKSASPDRIEQGIAIDAGGLLPDLAHTNSWVQTVEEVDPIELLEVQLCNSVAPFILVSRLRPSMAAAAARRKYV